MPLRKHAYPNILKILPPKNENFLIKNSDIFLISAENLDCEYSVEPPRRGGSNEYPRSMLLSRNKKNNVYPCKPQFYCIKVGFKGVKCIQVCFRDVLLLKFVDSFFWHYTRDFVMVYKCIILLRHWSRNKGMKHSWKKFPVDCGIRTWCSRIKNPML